MDHFVGIDLHSNNSYIAVIDKDNNRIFKNKARNNLSENLKLLALSKMEMFLFDTQNHLRYNLLTESQGLIKLYATTTLTQHE